MAISNLFTPKNRIVFKDTIHHIKKEALKMAVQGIIAALEGMKTRQNREAILQFTSYKKMMILGKKDPVLIYDDLIAQTQNTNVEIVQLPDGHMSHIENKEAVILALKSFVR